MAWGRTAPAGYRLYRGQFAAKTGSSSLLNGAEMFDEQWDGMKKLAQDSVREALGGRHTSASAERTRHNSFTPSPRIFRTPETDLSILRYP